MRRAARWVPLGLALLCGPIACEEAAPVLPTPGAPPAAPDRMPQLEALWRESVQYRSAHRAMADNAASLSHDVERSARMGDVMHGHMERLAQKHRSIRTHRNIGLFGTIELRKNSANERLVPYAGAHPAMAAVGKFLKDNGLFTMLQWSTLMCNPPLTISEREMADAFDIIDRALEITDAAFEG